MSGDLGFWMAMFTLGALAYFETPLGRLIRFAVHAVWDAGQSLMPHTDQPRDQRGRYASSGELVTSTGNDREPKLPDVTSRVTAQDSGVTTENDVTSQVTMHEAIFITAHLVQGVAPSRVTKRLPGFTPRHYDTFKAKVERVKDILADMLVEEVA